jgi:hypothetical protein
VLDHTLSSSSMLFSYLLQFRILHNSYISCFKKMGWLLKLSKSPPVGLLILNLSPTSRVLLHAQFRYYLTERHSSIAAFLQCIWHIRSSNPGERPAKLTLFSPLGKCRDSAANCCFFPRSFKFITHSFDAKNSWPLEASLNRRNTNLKINS